MAIKYKNPRFTGTKPSNRQSITVAGQSGSGQIWLRNGGEIGLHLIIGWQISSHQDFTLTVNYNTSSVSVLNSATITKYQIVSLRPKIYETYNANSELTTISFSHIMTTVIDSNNITYLAQAAVVPSSGTTEISPFGMYRIVYVDPTQWVFETLTENMNFDSTQIQIYPLYKDNGVYKLTSNGMVLPAGKVVLRSISNLFFIKANNNVDMVTFIATDAQGNTQYARLPDATIPANKVSSSLVSTYSGETGMKYCIMQDLNGGINKPTPIKTMQLSTRRKASPYNNDYYDNNNAYCRLRNDAYTENYVVLWNNWSEMNSDIYNDSTLFTNLLNDSYYIDSNFFYCSKNNTVGYIPYNYKVVIYRREGTFKFKLPTERFEVLNGQENPKYYNSNYNQFFAVISSNGTAHYYSGNTAYDIVNPWIYMQYPYQVLHNTGDVKASAVQRLTNRGTLAQSATEGIGVVPNNDSENATINGHFTINTTVKYGDYLPNYNSSTISGTSLGTDYHIEPINRESIGTVTNTIFTIQGTSGASVPLELSVFKNDRTLLNEHKVKCQLNYSGYCHQIGHGSLPTLLTSTDMTINFNKTALTVNSEGTVHSSGYSTYLEIIKDIRACSGIGTNFKINYFVPMTLLCTHADRSSQVEYVTSGTFPGKDEDHYYLYGSRSEDGTPMVYEPEPDNIPLPQLKSAYKYEDMIVGSDQPQNHHNALIYNHGRDVLGNGHYSGLTLGITKSNNADYGYAIICVNTEAHHEE